MIRRENSAFPFFTLFPVNFLKESQRAEEGKVINCRYTLRKLPRNEQENENYQ